MAISIKTPEDIEKMRVAGRLAAEVLEMIEPYVKPGVSTGELDRICNDYIVNEQHAKYKIISCSNYKSRKQNSKTIWLNKSNKICFKEKFSMYTQTLYELSQEAERLLQLSRQQLQLLEKIPLSVPGDDAPQLALPWSQPNIAERHAMLNNELRKISRLEMVLAIVGTMKAGKSTTINAIVGTEVLPNRNRPMTALPTLIRHMPG